MNKDFGCYCGFLADMIMKYAPEIKMHTTSTPYSNVGCFLLQKVHRLATVQELDKLHNRMQEAGMQFLSWVMHLTFVTHIFLLYHIIRI